LATGDLSEDASLVSYRELRRYFDLVGVPVLALPGNHDDPALLARMFPGSPVHDVEMSIHGEWQIIRLNSCMEGEVGGCLSGRTLEQLDNVLQSEAVRPKLVCLHHQPTAVNSPWIDKYPLFEPEAFLQLLGQSPAVKVVLWGHIHQVYQGQIGGIAMLGSPSSAINGRRDEQKFSPDSLGPAFRWLELEADGTWRTGISSI
jgi:Icc protein